ncbi:MAG: tetratricopeptide repeat protein [Candidatus Omnitrophica bacterium]|nr:tetratricopeptide repeat protein [Candidatus Omnitrophota bacterium]
MRKARTVFLSIFFAATFIALACLGALSAQDTAVSTPGAIFYQANIYYQEGKYEAAIKGYEKLTSLGLESGNLYYNLGNSYFKNGELGLAVLNYERAKGFIPNDSDLRSNYDYALQRLDLEPEFIGNRPDKLIYGLFQALTIDSLTALLSVIYIVLIVFLILNLFVGGFRRFSRWIIGVLVALFILFAFAMDRKINYLNRVAIVVNKEADVKFEPLENATTYFKLNEGSKVEVVEKTEGWYKVRRFDNKLGWVSKKALRQVAIN